MKKIAMFTMGTRGDVQPYIFLCRGLADAGYDVTLASHPCWKELIESYGIHFKPVGPDINIEEEAAVIRGKSSNAAIIFDDIWYPVNPGSSCARPARFCNAVRKA